MKCKSCKYYLAAKCLKNDISFYCVCEDSPEWGKVRTGDEEICRCYRKPVYDDNLISLKSALKTVTLSDYNIMFNHRLPDEKGKPFIAMFFKSNKDLEDYREAHCRLFSEYMRLAKEDGDFDGE